MKNSQIAIEILKTLEKEHINLYHDVSKNEILDYLAGIENLDEMSDMEFDYVMLKMFAKFKDAHTNYFITRKNIDKEIVYINGKFYILHNDVWKEIKKFGRFSPKEVYQKIREISCFETEEWLNSEIVGALRNDYVWEMLGIDKHVLTTDDEKIVIGIFDYSNYVSGMKKPIYEYKVVDGVLCFKYRKCQNDPSYPFETFMNDIKKVVEDNNIKNYILDLRGNTGGNSEILNPFQDFVKEKNLKGVLLIDNEVFSSGRFAVARFKRDFNTPLIGQPTGGAAKSYGYVKNLEKNGKRFSASIRLWDFSDVFGYEGAIQPDIYVEKTIDDYIEKKDSVLEVALQTIKDMKKERIK